MNRPNLDLSKDGIKTFLFRHIEKVILCLSVVLLGVLFWLGLSSEKFEAGHNPDDLVGMADAANKIMMEPVNWTKFSEYRNANTTADEIVKARVDLNPRGYLFGNFRGTPAKTAALRGDPKFLGVEGLMATTVSINLLMKADSDHRAYARLKTVSEFLSGKEEDDSGNGRSGIGSGGSFAGEDAPAETPSTKRRKKDDGEVEPGKSVPKYLVEESTGVRVGIVGANPTSARAEAFNAVVITGVVRFKDQWSLYDQAFRNARGYWPLRDRPIYRFVEVQRREIIDGEETEFEDISAQVSFDQKNAYAAEAPEVIHPECYDRVLSGVLPGIVGQDYRRFASWPLSGNEIPDGLNPDLVKMRDVFSYGTKREKEKDAEEDYFSSVGFGLDEEFGDGNSDGGRRGSDAGGRGSDGGGVGRGGTHRNGATSRDEERKGSDRTQYDAVARTRKQPEDNIYKVVRFFDLLAQPGRTYEYKIQLWLMDPNNEDPTSSIYEGEDEGVAGGSSRSRIGTAGGLAGGDENSGGSNNATEDEEFEIVKVSLQEAMLKNDVRNRLKRQNPWEFPVEQHANQRKGLSEVRMNEYLEYCYPTGYSTIIVTTPDVPDSIDRHPASPNVTVHAGAVEPARIMRIGNAMVHDGEPVAKVAASRLDDKYDTRVSILRDVRRGDYLNMQGNAHIVHPVTMAVYYLENYEADLNTMVVDIMGGTEIKSLGSGRNAVKYNVPGEVLVMTPDGLVVSNSLDDLGNFKRDLLLQDDGVDEETEMGNAGQSGAGQSGSGRGDNPGGNEGDGF